MLCIPSTRFPNFHQSAITVKTGVGGDSLYRPEKLSKMLGENADNGKL